MKAKILEFDTKAELIIINHEEEDPRDAQTNLAQIRCENKRRLVQVIKSEMVPKGDIGIPSRLAKEMGIEIRNTGNYNKQPTQKKGIPNSFYKRSK